jgi:hypothetical protein
VGALEVMGQIDVHVKVGDGMLFSSSPIFDAHWVFDIFDTNFIYGDVSHISGILNIGHASERFVHNKSSRGFYLSVVKGTNISIEIN